MIRKGICGVCERTIARRQDGTLRKHNVKVLRRGKLVSRLCGGSETRDWRPAEPDPSRRSFCRLCGRRSPEVEAMYARRDRLLDKRKRTKTEEAELAEIQGRIEQVPTASDPEDQAAMDLIRRAAALLEKKGLAGQGE